MQEDSKEVKRFWREYRAAVSSHGVPDPRADWFVRWAQRFARAMPGMPLGGRTKAHVRAFLSNLAHQAHVEPWQADQAQEALRVLYQDCLPLPWARPWPFHAQAMEPAKGEAQGTPFRDVVRSNDVDAKHQEVLNQLRTVIRARHYSLRTEQAYVHWM